MQDYLECEINGVLYSVAEIPTGEHAGKFCWSNNQNEEGNARDTFLEAYQEALDWEATRTDRERTRREAYEFTRRYAREQWHNRNGDVQ